MIDPAHPHTTAVEAVPLPAHDRRTYLDGPLPERLGRLVERLILEYTPSRGRPLLLLATTDTTFKAICAELKVPYDLARGTTAFYAWGPHAVVATPGLVAMLDHQDVRARLCGLRFLLHEWWHAMRTDRQRVYGLEEGGAELFADRLLDVLTGVDGRVRRIQAYQGLATGVMLLGERCRGVGTALAWALGSRSATDVGAWLTQEVARLGVERRDSDPIIQYSEDTSGSWAQLVQNILAGS